MKFYPSSFYWDKALFGSTDTKANMSCAKYSELKIKDGESKVIKACEILNDLTPEQVSAVELYGRSQYREGEESGESYIGDNS